MDEIIVKLLNMSIAAGWMILAVLLLRIILKKAQKRIVCILWGIVGVRLACPFSFGAVFSLIPSAETIQMSGSGQWRGSVIDSGISAVNNSLNQMIYRATADSVIHGVNPMDIWIRAAGIIWLIGCLFLLIYALISYIRMYAKVSEAICLKDNIWICDHVQAPFILGIIRPSIYLSSSMEEEQIKYVVSHEQAHIHRRDYWWKPLGFLLLAVYWFHPLIWIAYILFCRDVEMACDEMVIQNFDMEGKKAYSSALLSCSTQRRLTIVCPISFGKNSVKERIEAVMNYKKPSVWINRAASFACIMIAFCFLTNPLRVGVMNIVGSDGTDESPSVFIAGKLKNDGESGHVNAEGISEEEYRKIMELEDKSTKEKMDKEIIKNYPSREDIPYAVVYDEYRAGKWWGGILRKTEDFQLTGSNIYQAAFEGMLYERE
ncbi:MAG: M56 family metallopeptidase [Eubacteriales bacterium]|nr:M56 family metallopeptidase [Eubacteriales bacterium]